MSVSLFSVAIIFLIFYLNVNYYFKLKCTTCQRVVAIRRGSVLIENGLYFVCHDTSHGKTDDVKSVCSPGNHRHAHTSSIQKKKYMHTSKLRRLLDQSGLLAATSRPAWCVMIVIILMSQRWKYHIFSSLPLASWLFYRRPETPSSLFDLQLMLKRNGCSFDMAN